MDSMIGWTSSGLSFLCCVQACQLLSGPLVDFNALHVFDRRDKLVNKLKNVPMKQLPYSRTNVTVQTYTVIWIVAAAQSH